MEFAIIETGSKQYKVSKGDKLWVELLHKKEGAKLSFKPLFYWDGKAAKIGKPQLSDHVVEAKVVGEIRGEKLRIVKKKAKKRYQRAMGHRQNYTVIEILKT